MKRIPARKQFRAGLKNMNQQTIKLARKKILNLQKQYFGFNNIILDNWRENRLIFDTQDVINCKNQCQKCLLYKLLINEKENPVISSALFPASKEDKKTFGKQRFLNCKTLEQYQNCYINFLIQKTNSKQEIQDELNLILKECNIIYSKNNQGLKKINRQFKLTILKRVLSQVNKSKQLIIINILKKYKINL